MQVWRWFLAIGLLLGGPGYGGEFNTAPGIVVTGGMALDGTSVILRMPPGASESGYHWTPPEAPVNLGDLPGGATRTRPLAISGDGHSVVGWSSSANGDAEAFRWTATSGMTGLGDIAGGRFESEAMGCNYDGSLLYGTGRVNVGGVNVPQAAKWDAVGTLEALGFLPGGKEWTVPIDCADSAPIIIGSGYTAAGASSWRWVPDTGMVDLGLLPVQGAPEGRQNAPLACNSDATLVAGLAYSAEHSLTVGPTSLWIWSQDTGFTIVADAPGGEFPNGAPAVFGSNALVSSDLSTIVATYAGNSASGILRWRAGHGIDDMEFPGKAIAIHAISANGSVVVGSMTDAQDTTQAVLWGPDGRLRPLKQFLESAQTDTGAFEPLVAYAVSADGRTIAGSIRVEDPYQPLAFHATLDGLWLFDIQINEFWNQSPWYGFYSNVGTYFFWHAEHGWQYCTGTSELSVFVYDYGVQSWLWTSEELYPFFYKFGHLEGWVYYYVGCEPTHRWFYLYDLATNLTEEDLRPAGY